MLICENCKLERLQPPEAATYLGVSSATLNKYRKDGWLLASKNSVGYTYTKENLEETKNLIAKRNRGVTYDNE